jgi:hypothetical protein
VRLKWFLGNSFYLQGGAGLRQMQATDSSVFFSSLVVADTYKSTFSSSYAIGEIGLGNRWQFSNFTIGCDWVGYAVPLAKLSSSESFTGPITESQKASDRDNFDKRSSEGNLMLLRFHLGVSF